MPLSLPLRAICGATSNTNSELVQNGPEQQNFNSSTATELVVAARPANIRKTLTPFVIYYPDTFDFSKTTTTKLARNNQIKRQSVSLSKASRNVLLPRLGNASGTNIDIQNLCMHTYDSKTAAWPRLLTFDPLLPPRPDAPPRHLCPPIVSPTAPCRNSCTRWCLCP